MSLKCRCETREREKEKIEYIFEENDKAYTLTLEDEREEIKPYLCYLINSAREIIRENG